MNWKTGLFYFLLLTTNGELDKTLIKMTIKLKNKLLVKLLQFPHFKYHFVVAFLINSYQIIEFSIYEDFIFGKSRFFLTTSIAQSDVDLYHFVLQGYFTACWALKVGFRTV